MTIDEKIRFLLDLDLDANALKGALIKVTSSAAGETPPAPQAPLQPVPRTPDNGRRLSMPDVVRRIAAAHTLPVSMSYTEIARECGISGRSTSALGVYIKSGGGSWVTEGVRVTSRVAKGARGRHLPTIYRFERV